MIDPVQAYIALQQLGQRNQEQDRQRSLDTENSFIKGSQMLSDTLPGLMRLGKWGDFTKKIQSVINTSGTPEEKMKNLLDISLTHPNEWKQIDGQGILDSYSKVYGKEWKPTSQEQALQFESAKAGLKAYYVGYSERSKNNC
jgi:hypothetical protein